MIPLRSPREPGFGSVNNDDTVTVRVNHSEMGQGVTTALAMIIAEELEADWSKIAIEIAPAEAVYKNPEFNAQFTGASTSIKTSWDILRNAGACAREMIVAAAAKKWKVSISECLAHKGTVVHKASGRKLSFGELVTTAAGLPLPKSFKLKKDQPVQTHWPKDSTTRFGGKDRWTRSIWD